MQAAADDAALIHVAKGQYDGSLGESFPLVVRPGTSIVGAGVGATIIQGVGSYDRSPAGGPLLVHRFHQGDDVFAVHPSADVFHGGDGNTVHHQPDRGRAIVVGGPVDAQASVEA
ncbi:MAG: DUF1565 domain-containing protein [Actinobacteria bacterium]|nr:DUF1565 domain-containing protein [Actinomycetota bacterium]